MADFSLLANSTDQNIKLPGELKAHKIAEHPRPERWIAAGWLSPFNGRVEILPAVRDAHSSCGNGVIWSLSGDCADSIESGNPHSDQHGNLEVWPFHGGLNDEVKPTLGVPPGSLRDS